MTLIEMMVTIAITAIVVTGAFKIFAEGAQLFRTHQASADAQINAMKVLARISAEAVNATPSAAKSYPKSGSKPPALVFASSTTPAGSNVFDPDSGAIAWQRYVCYYFKPDPTGGDDGKVWRAEAPITPKYPTTIPSGNIDVFGTVGPWVADPSHDADYFATLPTQALISRGISGFDVDIYTGSVGGAGTTIRRSFNVTVEAGNKSQSLKNSFYIEMESKITPRG